MAKSGDAKNIKKMMLPLPLELYQSIKLLSVAKNTPMTKLLIEAAKSYINANRHVAVTYLEEISKK